MAIWIAILALATAGLLVLATAFRPRSDEAPGRVGVARMAIAGAAPLIAILVYAATGAPDFRPTPVFAEPGPQKAPDAEMIAGMVARLEERLKTEPDDLEGWLMLARSREVLGDPAASAEALARASALAPDRLDLKIARANALLGAAPVDGPSGEPRVDAAALAAFEAVHDVNPDHPLTLYVLGLAARQRGDAPAARGYWERLIAQMPSDRPETERLRGDIDALGG